MRLKKGSFLLIYLLFVLACAKQSSPTGGPKDTIPPRVIHYSPANKTINFKGRTFELTLNEHVQLKNAKEEIIINPSIGKDYKIQARKNKITLTSETDLQDSTTYTINFRDAVSDITESNPVVNLRMAISTGPYIDSLSIAGMVTTLLDQKPAEDVTVAVQPYSDTFSLFKHPSTYFTKTDKKGKYILENLKPGAYWLTAIKDANRNLIADSKSELYAFKRDSIYLTTNKPNTNLALVKQDARPLKINSGRPYSTYFNIKTSKNIESYAITPTNDSIDISATFGSDHQNIIIYNTIGKLDSTQVKVHVRDSINNQSDSVFYIKFRPATPEKFAATVSSARVLGHARTLSFKVQFTKPVNEINFDSLYFKIDSLNTVSFQPSELAYDPPTRVLTVSKKLQPGMYIKPPDAEDRDAPPTPETKKLNELHIGRGAFISVEADSSSNIVQNVEVKWESDLGVIIAETRSDSKIILQLVNRNLEVIQSINGTKATFTDLEPSDYLLRMIIDRNGNGKWDAGNYLIKEEPEQIIYYQTEKGERETKLKANYEIGPLLITY